jgi:hypothetical protein
MIDELIKILANARKIEIALKNLIMHLEDSIFGDVEEDANEQQQ